MEFTIIMNDLAILERAERLFEETIKTNASHPYAYANLALICEAKDVKKSQELHLKALNCEKTKSYDAILRNYVTFCRKNKEHFGEEEIVNYFFPNSGRRKIKRNF